MIIAQDKSFNAGHSTFTLVEVRTNLYPTVGTSALTVYTLYHNSCILWQGESRDEGMQEFNKITIPAR